MSEGVQFLEAPPLPVGKSPTFRVCGTVGSPTSVGLGHAWFGCIRPYVLFFLFGGMSCYLLSGFPTCPAEGMMVQWSPSRESMKVI